MMNKDLQEHQAKAAQREDELLNEIEERKQEIVELRERLQWLTHIYLLYYCFNCVAQIIALDPVEAFSFKIIVLNVYFC